MTKIQITLSLAESGMLVGFLAQAAERERQLARKRRNDAETMGNKTAVSLMINLADEADKSAKEIDDMIRIINRNSEFVV